MNNLALGITIALRDAFSARARVVERQLRSLDGSATAASRGISNAIGRIEAGFSAALRTIMVGMGALALAAWPVKQAMEFGKALSQVATIADGGAESVKKFTGVLMDQAFRFPSTPAAQARGLYETIQSGFLNAADAIKVTEDATQLGVVGMTDTMTAVDGLTSVLNAYSLGAEHSNMVSNQLFETVKYGKVSMEELARTIGMISPVAAGAGLEISEMLGMYAAMTMGGLSGEQSAQYGRQILSGIIKPTRQAAIEAEKLGLNWSAQGIKEAGGLMNLLEEAWMKTGARGNMESFARLLSGRQAITGALTILNSKATRDRARRIIEGIENPYVTDEFGIRVRTLDYGERQRMKELDYQWERFKSAIVGAAIVAGQAAKQFLTPLVGTLASMFGWLMKLFMAFPMLSKVLYLVATAAGIATVAFGGLLLKETLMNEAVKGLITKFTALKVELWGTSITAGKAFRLLSGGFILLAGLMWLARNAWEKNLGGIQEKVTNFVLLFRSVTYALTHMSGTWGEVPQELYEQLQKHGLWDTFKDLFMLFYRIKVGVQAFVEGVKGFFLGMGNAITGIMGKVIGLVGKFSKPLAEAIQQWWDSLSISSSSIESWKEWGKRVGNIAGAILAIVLATKLWASAVFLMRGAWMVGVLKPLHIARLLLWTMPNGAISRLGILKTAWQKFFVWLAEKAAAAKVAMFGKINPGWTMTPYGPRGPKGRFGSIAQAGYVEGLFPMLLRKAKQVATAVRTIFMGGFAGASGVLRGLAAGFMALARAALAFMAANPFTWVLLAIPVIVLLVKHWEAVWGVVDGFMNWLQGKLKWMPTALKVAFPILALSAHWDVFKEKAAAAFDWLREKFRSARNWFRYMGQLMGISADPREAFARGNLPHYVIARKMTLEQLETQKAALQAFVDQWGSKMEYLRWLDRKDGTRYAPTLARLMQALNWTNQVLDLYQRNQPKSQQRAGENRPMTPAEMTQATADGVEQGMERVTSRLTSPTDMFKWKWGDARNIEDPYARYDEARWRAMVGAHRDVASSQQAGSSNLASELDLFRGLREDFNRFIQAAQQAPELVIKVGEDTFARISGKAQQRNERQSRERSYLQPLTR